MKIPSEWNEEEYREFLEELLRLSDITYKNFNFKIIFTNYEKIGIRMPILKDLAKKIVRGNARSFLEVVGDVYYEEVILEGLVISMLSDLELCLSYFERYIEKIDNWALCDNVIASMKIVKNNRDLFLKRIKKYLKSKDEYRVRVGFVLLLNYYVEEDYIDQIFDFCNSVKLDTYYVNMSIAWLISECFVKEKGKTIEFLACNELNDFTQNKAISKIRDSYRVSGIDKLTVLDFKR